nr:alcohol dehydrogenase 1 [Quercus suber]
MLLWKPILMYCMGGLAEYCVVPAHALSILPNLLPYTESAILGCAIFTAYGAMAHAAEVRPGDSVAVIGIGVVGSRMIMSFAKLINLKNKEVCKRQFTPVISMVSASIDLSPLNMEQDEDLEAWCNLLFA